MHPEKTPERRTERHSSWRETTATFRCPKKTSQSGPSFTARRKTARRKCAICASTREGGAGRLSAEASQVACQKLDLPMLDLCRSVQRGVLKASGGTASTTMVVVRMLSKLLRDKNLGRYVVPIVPDEARTFGMDGLFPQAGIYSPCRSAVPAGGCRAPCALPRGAKTGRYCRRASARPAPWRRFWRRVLPMRTTACP